MKPYAKMTSEYEALWETMQVRPEWAGRIDAAARLILRNKPRYVEIESSSGVPWYVVGLIHALEAGGDFSCHLHNGDPLTARTVNVPRGLPRSGGPPFRFEASAVDALRHDGLDRVDDWALPRIAYELERYNGTGYRDYHPDVLTPYLWSGTHHYTRGKYESDGDWNAALVSKQAGAMPILKRMADLDPSIVLDAPYVHPSTEHTRTPSRNPDPETMWQSTTARASEAVGAGGTVNTAMEVSSAVAKVSAKGAGWSAAEFLVALASSPGFWIGLFSVVAAAYIWLERMRKLPGRRSR